MSLARRNPQVVRRAAGFRPSYVLFAVLILLISSSFSQAQRWHASKKQLSRQLSSPFEDMAHMSWVHRDGAPGDVAALAQTKDGYLWIGSRLGLFRFDGLQFESYPFISADPRLPSSDISALAGDVNGGLWIGYRTGGISYLRGNQKVDYDQHSGLVSQSTEQLLCRDDGSVWATADGRLMHLNGSTWENYSAKHGLASEGLYSLFFDRDGNLWTAEKGHVYELKSGAEKFVAISIPNHAVNQFAQTPDGTIWITDAWHNVRPLTDDKGLLAERIPGVPLLLVDNEGSLWIANDFGGLTRIKFPQTGRKVENYSPANGLSDGQTRAILKDRSGAIWVGTARGLDRFQPTPLLPFHGVHLDYHPAVTSGKGSGIWIDDMDKPLMRLQGEKLAFIGSAHGSSSLFVDANGSVWSYDPITHNFFGYADNGSLRATIPVPPAAREVENYCLGVDSHGALLACFEGHGLWRFSGTWEQVKAAELPLEAPVSFGKGDSNQLWFGYPHNQIVLADGTRFHVYDAKDGLELNSVLTFYVGDGLVLAGGSDGLAYFDGSNFHSLHLRSPSLLRGVSGIVKDRFGDLWLNASSGILRLPANDWKTALKNAKYAMDFQLFNEQDGLFGSPAQGKPSPSVAADVNGTVWFATSGHLYSIDPAAVRTEHAAPSVLLQTVRVNGAPVAHDVGLPISVDSRHFKSLEFDYIGVDLKSPDRVVYQYMLEGQDKEWQEAGNRRQASYTNLGPGKYNFRIRAGNGTGRWNELQAPVRFTVTPAFYQTSWFLILCGAATIGALYLLYMVRLKQVAQRVRLRMEERLEERERIARDLHDTLLQSVQGLIWKFQGIAKQIPATEPAHQAIEKTLDLADMVLAEGRDRVRNLRESSASHNDLQAEFRRVAEAAPQGNATFKTVVEGRPRELHPMVLEEVYCIGREALLNALNHSRGQHIEVEIAYDSRQFRMRVRDDGSGIDSLILEQGGRPGHWGMRGMRERAQRIGALLELWSRPAAGTEVELTVPAASAYRTLEKKRFLVRWSAS